MPPAVSLEIIDFHSYGGQSELTVRDTAKPGMHAETKSLSGSDWDGLNHASPSLPCNSPLNAYVEALTPNETNIWRELGFDKIMRVELP